MKRQYVTQNKQQSKSETPLVSGILQRAGVRSVPEKEVQHSDEIVSPSYREAGFQQDFTQVPVHTGGLSVIQAKGYGTTKGETGKSSESIGTFEVNQENKTRLSNNLKAGIENLSGISMDDVKVHYNSSKPAQLQALAYTQGTNIYIGSGQEKHLPHEAWHVVQQKQGRVKPTLQAKEVRINDDRGLEREANVMGNRANTMLNEFPLLAKLIRDKHPHVYERQTSIGLSEKRVMRDLPHDLPLNVIQCSNGDEHALMSKSRSIKKAPKKERKRKKVSIAALKKKFKKELQNKEFGRATGHTSSGEWTKEVTVRAPYSFAGNRVRQVLRHIATAVYHYVKSKVNDEQEVQALYVNGSILLSSNLPKSMEELKDIDGSELKQILLSDKFTNSDKRASRYIKKLKAVIEGKRIEKMKNLPDEIKNILEIIAKTLKNAMKEPEKYFLRSNIEETNNHIAANKTNGNEGKLVTVQGSKPVHAEQNLILSYYKSGVREPGYVYGKKRPCTVCYMTLRYAKDKLALNLDFNDNPGGYWSPAIDGFHMLIHTHTQESQEMETEDVYKFIEEKLPSMNYRTQDSALKDQKKPRNNTKNEQTGYDTASDSEMEDNK